MDWGGMLCCEGKHAGPQKEGLKVEQRQCQHRRTRNNEQTVQYRRKLSTGSVPRQTVLRRSFLQFRKEQNPQSSSHESSVLQMLPVPL